MPECHAIITAHDRSVALLARNFRPYWYQSFRTERQGGPLMQKTMLFVKERTRQQAAARAAMTAIVIGALVLLSPGAPVWAQSSDSQARTVHGVWSLVVTVRNCDTGDALGPPFRSLVTFHQGGTISESVGTLSFAPNQRTPAHGLWAHDGGQSYRLRMIAAILFDTDPPTPAGFKAGWQVFDSKITLSDADHQTATAVVRFYDLNGQVYRTVCPTHVGERFR
jgi:hypothetical protein